MEGAENIRKKLEMIRNTAMKVKTTSFNKDETGNNVEGGRGVKVDLLLPWQGITEAPLNTFQLVNMEWTIARRFADLLWLVSVMMTLVSCSTCS